MGTYTGQFGFLLVENGREPGGYDQEVNLAVHHWEPAVRADGGDDAATSLRIGRRPRDRTWAISYASLNGHMLGAGEPMRVKQGQRVLMRLLNASATENVVLALAGTHGSLIVAMDGNPVPRPHAVEVLSLGVAERVDAVVEMNEPGVWVLGSTIAAERAKGLGVVIEYAGQKGEPVWRDPAAGRVGLRAVCQRGEGGRSRSGRLS